MNIFTSGITWARELTATTITTTAKQMACEKEINITISLNFKFISIIFISTKKK